MVVSSHFLIKNSQILGCTQMTGFWLKIWKSIWDYEYLIGSLMMGCLWSWNQTLHSKPLWHASCLLALPLKHKHFKFNRPELAQYLFPSVLFYLDCVPGWWRQIEIEYAEAPDGIWLILGAQKVWLTLFLLTIPLFLDNLLYSLTDSFQMKIRIKHFEDKTSEKLGFSFSWKKVKF